MLENIGKIGDKSISDLAKELNIADSTIFQFTKKLGFNGYKDFKIAILIQENNKSSVTSITENIKEGDSELQIAQKVFESNIATIKDTSKLLVEEDLEKVGEILTSTDRLFLFGLGGSEVVASDGYHKFLRSSINVFHSTDYHIQLMEAAQLTENDCAIIISHSGRTKESLEIAKLAKETSAKIIIITSHTGSTLTEYGDLVFISIPFETEFRSEALASRIAQLSILDSFFVIYQYANRDSSDDSISKVRKVISNQRKKI